MYGKIIIKSDLKVLTGLHIGGSEAFSAIGAVDSPVIRDAKTKNPIIPGSSIKGKLRTLLAKTYCKGDVLPQPNNDDIAIKRLFGSSSEPIEKSRLQFSDMFILNKEELSAVGLTEVKFENVIDRETARAMPRQIERIISGVKFGFYVVYDILNDGEIIEDMNNLKRAMKLLQIDYLGGSGTRGYGRVSFENFVITQLEDSVPDETLNEIKIIFEEVENYALLSL